MSDLSSNIRSAFGNCQILGYKETSLVRMELCSNFILRVIYKKEANIDLEANKQIINLMYDLIGDDIVGIVFISEGRVQFSSDAMKYARKMEEIRVPASVAIIASGLGEKLLADFYFRFHKPKFPYRVFRNLEEALMWSKKTVDEKRRAAKAGIELQ